MSEPTIYAVSFPATIGLMCLSQRVRVILYETLRHPFTTSWIELDHGKFRVRPRP